jgi:predicted ABC-type sugar transport system permease subunit
MWVVLPVAGISIPLPLLFGVGGGLLVTLLLMMLGVPTSVEKRSLCGSFFL